MTAKPPSPRPSTKLAPLEYRVWRALQEIPGVAGSAILVACSGGADSIVCLEILARLAQRLELTLKVATVHHGDDRSVRVRTARASAVSCARAAAKRLGLEFHAARHSGTARALVSEAELRAFRHGVLEKLALEHDCAFIAFAHHADDLFETRLIRLIRGTGPQGLEAMRARRENKLRPLLGERREELRAYAAAKGLRWHEDPTNMEKGPLRNWLRAAWLPALEAKRPGSTNALARSLAQLAAACQDDGFSERPAVSVRFERNAFSRLEKSERAAQIAAALLSLRARDFTAAHISEISKRMLSRRAKHFRLLSLDWRINAEHVIVSRS